MKVFEVITEHCEGDSIEITTTIQYVTAASDTLLDVTKYYTEQCYQYDKELKGIREVLTIVEQIGE